MNISIFISTLNDGGTERVTCNLCNYLVKRGHDITILTLIKTDKPEYDLDKNVKYIALSSKYDVAGNVVKEYYTHIWRYYNLREYVKKAKSDVYLVMLPLPTYMLLSLKKLIKAPIIVSERSDPNFWYGRNGIKKILMKKLYPHADAFVFQTEDAKAFYHGIVKGESVVIPNAINKNFLKEPFRGERKKSIVSVGRLCQTKNFPLLLQSFSMISKKYQEYQLCIYGGGNLLPELAMKAKALGISEKVTLAGNVDNPEQMIADAALFVMSSDHEGMPNALAEAMALGLPCISTDCPCGGPKFLIDNNINGLLVPTGDEVAMAEAMDRVLSNKELADSLGAKAYEIRKELDPDHIYHLWEDFLIENVINYRIKSEGT